MLTTTERRELRTLIRSGFKLLRGEVKATASAVKTAGVKEINAEYAETQTAIDKLMDQAQAAIEKGAARAEQILAGLSEIPGVKADRFTVSRGYISGSTVIPGQQAKLRDLDAEVSNRLIQATQAIDRQEYELLRSVGMDALESAQAHALVGEIPTVQSLMGFDTAAELVAQIG